MLEFEKKLYSQGIKLIAGIDEVGRGPLAGPMVVGAVILDLNKVFRNYDVEYGKYASYKFIDDSKKISDTKRRFLSKFIIKECISYSLYEVSPRELDLKGVARITQEAFSGAINTLKTKPEFILTDTFEIKQFPKQVQFNIIKGDTKSISIAAASIVAKVYRDDIMIKYATKYPGYGFEKHKGYGTKAHFDAIYEHGPCEIHRKSFEPLKSLSLKFR